jgi:ABC-type glutathione transport system ATPase component
MTRSARACRQDKRERVDGVIAALGLDKCRGTLIGGPMRRGVSGGERKRVSVAHELLIDPSVLILDEVRSHAAANLVPVHQTSALLRLYARAVGVGRPYSRAWPSGTQERGHERTSC